jgi:hypothetical protein
MTLNLSCGNCKAIRSFSGTPPTCETCGWVYSTTNIRALQATITATRETPSKAAPSAIPSKSYGVVAGISHLAVDGAKGFFWLMMFGLAFYFVYQWFTPEKTKLSDEYHVPQAQVFVEPKPHGCDFEDAPLGNKHCHYEKEVNVQRACGGPDCRVTAVYEGWHRVEG